MVYEKKITDEGKNEILKLAFLNENSNPFCYCALGREGSTASSTGDWRNFNEFTGSNYHREQITSTGPQNNRLEASCIFNDDNYYDTEQGLTVTEIALCNSYEEESPLCFAFSQVPEIKKTGNVSLKYTWIINIE